MSAVMSAPSVRKKKSFALNSRPSVRMCIRDERDAITMSSPEVCWPVPMRAIGAQNLLTMPGGVSISGYLHKKGGSQFSLLKWPLRYIIIHKGCVYYFKSSTSPAPQGAFSLNGYNRVMRAAEETTSSNVFPFKIVHFSKKHRTWFFSAASEDERRKWMRYLRKEIDYYNDRRDSHIPSDSDSDADSFYGTIEKPMEITHSVHNAEDDYMEEDEDEDEEDYLKPDSDCTPTSTGRPTGPPPSYPPPPVPAALQHRQDSSASFHKGPPPPVPLHSKTPTSPPAKKTPPSFPPPSFQKDPPPNKGPPPPLPFVPHLQKTPSLAPPPPPPPNAKRQLHCRMASVPEPGRDKRDPRPPPTVTVQSPAALPICNQLESRMVLNDPTHNSTAAGGRHSPGVGRHGMPSKPAPPLPPPPNFGHISHRSGTSDPPTLTHMPPCYPPPPSPHALTHPKTGLHSKPSMPKPPSPTAKPPAPAAKTKRGGGGPSLQRASPDGQSFRSSVDETPADYRKKREMAEPGGGEESDDDYENMQLPDSVFIDTTETSNVEKLFKESDPSPQDGLYGIRNSGTKTSKVLVVWDVSLGKARNYRLFEEDQRVFLDTDTTFPSLEALVEHYHSHPLPHQGSLCLQQPYG